MQRQIVLFAKHLARGPHEDQVIIDQASECIRIARKHRDAQIFFMFPNHRIHVGPLWFFAEQTMSRVIGKRLLGARFRKAAPQLRLG